MIGMFNKPWMECYVCKFRNIRAVMIVIGLFQVDTVDNDRDWFISGGYR